MNSTPCRTKKREHQSRSDIPGIVSSAAPAASVEAVGKIFPLEMLRVQNASECSSLSSLSSSTAVVNASAVKGSDMQDLRIPTKSEKCKPGPTLNPASCASGLAMIGGGFGIDSTMTTTLSKSTNDADVNAVSREGSDMGTQDLRIPTKSENCKPGPPLNPASCASGLAMIFSGFGEADDWTSAPSLTMQVERINDAQVQGNTHRRNRSYPNEEWGDLHYYPQAQGNNMFLGEDGI